MFLITLSALLPVVLLSYFLLFEEAQNHKRNTVESARDLMRATVTAIDAELDHSVAALDALAASPRLRDGNLHSFRQEARNFLERRPDWSNIVLATPDAQQLVNARLPDDTSLPHRVDPAGVAHVAKTKQSRYGPLVYSPVLRQFGFSVMSPIIQDDEVRYVLTAVFLPRIWQNQINRTKLPAGAIMTILDSQYKVAARSRNEGEWIGKTATESSLQLLRQERLSDAAIATTLDGQRVYLVFEKSDRSGWIAALGIPVGIVDAPANRLYGMLAIGILLSAVLGFLVAFIIGRSITRPAKALEKAAIALGYGEQPELPKTGIAEIRKIGEALLNAYQDREAALAKERQARESAENASKAKDEFLAMLSHELRNPLAPIHSVAQLLKMPGLSQERIASLGATVERQTKHLVRLVNDLLDASRVTRRLVTLQKEIVNVRSALHDAVEQIKDRANKNRHELRLSLVGEPVFVLADRARLIQIFVNLLDNAVKYTPQNGIIAVEVTPLDETVRIAVRDNGAGISPELLPRIFDLFQQSDRSLDRQTGGLGIGLSIVKGLVELHGGTLTAHSDGAGKGSEFVVEMTRVRTDMPQVMELRQPFSGDDLRNVTVVIVDDNVDAAEAVSCYLAARFGCNALQFHDPEIALAKIIDTVPDVCILDIGMPGMDGYTLVKLLKTHHALKDTVFIALTGYGSPLDKQNSAAAGFDHHVTKPVDIDELARFIVEAMQKRSPAFQIE
ncbi:hybrid sensor histidine kinase/response regulator [Paucimonas lemoignei]|uniref:hybrid sensor histidine kinase/response regulator n=1 Tax=Paucimonas lemoignei TaxID=29443 RepID=UPI0014052CBB|nr:ATP-binding protein [Paucimonas lemoignei]